MAVLTVVACGSTFVLITAGVDLSVGSVAILGEVVAAKTIIAAGESGVVDACLGIVAGIAVGVLVGIVQRRSASPTSRCRRSSSPSAPC